MDSHQMRLINGSLVSLVAFCCVCLLDLAEAPGEQVYRWVRETGEVSYSNVAPPANQFDYSIVTMPKAPVKDQKAKHVSSDAAISEHPKSPGSDAPKSEIDPSRAFLLERIHMRENSIHQIEALLRKRPGDHALRRSLYRKRQYLQEDLNGLKRLSQ